MSQDRLKQSKQWILTHPHLMQHVGRQHYMSDTIQQLGTESVTVYTPVALEYMTVTECLEELRLWQEIWQNITSFDMELDEEWPLPMMKSKLRWYYSTESHSLLLRWIGQALAVDELIV